MALAVHTFTVKRLRWRVLLTTVCPGTKSWCLQTVCFWLSLISWCTVLAQPRVTVVQHRTLFHWSEPKTLEPVTLELKTFETSRPVYLDRWFWGNHAVLLSRKVRWRQNIGRVLRRRFFLTSWPVTYLTLTQCWPLTEWLVVLRRCWRGATVEVWRPSGRRWWLVLVMRVWVEGRQLDDVDRLWWLSRRVDRRVTQSSWNCQQQTSRVVYDEHHTTTVHTQSQLDATPYSYSAYITDTFAISTCMLNHCLDWYKCQRTYTTPDSGSTHLLHDLSPDGGIYPTILFCKLLTVTRETINWP